MKKNGFIATSLIFSFFLLFVAIMMMLLTNYAHSRVLSKRANEEIVAKLNSTLLRPVKEYSLTNLVSNGSFEAGTTGWANTYNATSASISECKYYGSYGYHLYPSNNTLQEAYVATINPINYYANHNYYAAYMFEGPDVYTQLYFPLVNPYPRTLVYSSNYAWTKNSLYVNSGSIIASGSYKARFDLNNSGVYKDVCIDGYFIIDLTATFGSGNEPTKAWCDANLTYFDGTITKTFNY